MWSDVVVRAPEMVLVNVKFSPGRMGPTGKSEIVIVKSSPSNGVSSSSDEESGPEQPESRSATTTRGMRIAFARTGGSKWHWSRGNHGWTEVVIEWPMGVLSPLI